MVIKDVNLQAYLHNSVDPDLIDQYKQVIQESDLKTKAKMIMFDEDENLHQNREALKLAAQDLDIPIKVIKKRGQNTLVFWQITKKEYEELEKSRKERMANMRRSKKNK